jgi:hypothetical protein
VPVIAKIAQLPGSAPVGTHVAALARPVKKIRRIKILVFIEFTLVLLKIQQGYRGYLIMDCLVNFYLFY